ncbi:MAG TPA: hypothetical protein VF928_04505 [Usitatibacteraceae bacterium]
MSSRTKFVLIFLLFSIPFVGSTIAFVFWKPTATNNYGELLSPTVSLPETKLEVLDAGSAYTDDLTKSLRGKWLMLTHDSGACDPPCQKKLYAMRQSRLMLGREQDRVLRVVLLEDDVIPGEGLRQKFAGTVWVSAKTQLWLKILPHAGMGPDTGRAYIYGIDPLGNVFIRYGADPDIRRMNQDFQRVLKASQIG